MSRDIVKRMQTCRPPRLNKPSGFWVTPLSRALRKHPANRSSVSPIPCARYLGEEQRDDKDAAWEHRCKVSRDGDPGEAA